MKRLNVDLSAIRAILITAGIAGFAVVGTSALLPQEAEADRRSFRGERFSQCRTQLRSATRQLRKTERDLAHYKQAYEDLASRRDQRRWNRRDHRDHAMSRRAFSRLHQQFKDAGFKSSRIKLMHRALRDGYLTVAQLTALLRICDFDSGRVEIAAMAYPRVVDPQNWVTVYDTFSFSSSGRKLDRKLGLDR